MVVSSGFIVLQHTNDADLFHRIGLEKNGIEKTLTSLVSPGEHCWMKRSAIPLQTPQAWIIDRSYSPNAPHIVDNFFNE